MSSVCDKKAMIINYEELQSSIFPNIATVHCSTKHLHFNRTILTTKSQRIHLLTKGMNLFHMSRDNFSRFCKFSISAILYITGISVKYNRFRYSDNLCRRCYMISPKKSLGIRSCIYMEIKCTSDNSTRVVINEINCVLSRSTKLSEELCGMCLRSLSELISDR